MRANPYMSYRVRTPDGREEYFEEEKDARDFVRTETNGEYQLMSQYIVEKCVLRAVAARKHITQYWQRIPMSPTDIERIVMRALIDKGYVEGEDFVFQYPFEGYILDFAFTEEKLDVECDAEYWHPEENPKDKRRDSTMKRKGWLVLRFGDKQIKFGLATVVAEIDTTVKRLRGAA